MKQQFNDVENKAENVDFFQKILVDKFGFVQDPRQRSFLIKLMFLVFSSLFPKRRIQCHHVIFFIFSVLSFKFSSDC